MLLSALRPPAEPQQQLPRPLLHPQLLLLQWHLQQLQQQRFQLQLRPQQQPKERLCRPGL
jgi:hypothetical protein